MLPRPELPPQWLRWSAELALGEVSAEAGHPLPAPAVAKLVEAVDPVVLIRRCAAQKADAADALRRWGVR